MINGLAIKLYRSDRGLEVNVKAHPEVEQTISGWTGGTIQNVREYGRSWMNTLTRENIYGEMETAPLSVYALPNEPEFRQALPLRGVEGVGQYRIDAVGAPLRNRDEGSLDSTGLVLNMSFVRLQGISRDDGVTFSVGQVITPLGLKLLGKQFSAGALQFTLDFLKPVSVNVEVIMSELMRPNGAGLL